MCLEKYTEVFKEVATPFYFYDVALLTETLNALKQASQKYNYHIHYSLKSNSNPKILQLIKDYGFGADCVSNRSLLLRWHQNF